MADTKYTSDGKRVVVIGKLNAKQHIVQEVFVTQSGDEVPSGDNFVVAGLHDEPVESWHEKRLRENKQRYEDEKARQEAEMRRSREVVRKAKERAKQFSGALRSLCKRDESKACEQLDTLFAFLAGEITHFYVDGYPPKIVTFDDPDLFTEDMGRSGAIKLVSLLGRSDGSLSYGLNHYSDGSGSSTRVVPCKSYDEALRHAQEQLDGEAATYVEKGRGRFSLDRWERIEGIVIPQAAREMYDEKQALLREIRIKKLRDEIAQLESGL